MRSNFPLYSIFLLGLTTLRLSQAQGTSDTSTQQQQALDDAATALATLQDQTPKDITALQALASNGVFEGNARLASENSLLIAILGGIPKLAQDLSAALNQTNIPAATPTPTPTTTPTPTPTPTPVTPPSQDPAVLKEQCNLLQALSNLLTSLEQRAKSFASNSDGGASIFLAGVRIIQTLSSCQGNPSNACKSFNDLGTQFQAAGAGITNSLKRFTDAEKNSAGVISLLTGQISSSASSLEDAVTEIKTSLQC